MKKISMIQFFIFFLIFNSPNAVFASSSGGSTSASKYFQLSPQLVVNVNDNGKARHLQIAIQLRLDNPADNTILNEHKPAIQHALVMLLSGREAKDVRSTQGKEALRNEATEELKKVLLESTGHTVINAVYFTAFVIQ